MEKEWMTTKDLSAYLQVPESTIQRFLNNDEIPHYDTLGSPRFFKAEIDEWMKDGATNKQDAARKGDQYLYRGTPILDYKLAASRVLIGKTALARLPGFIKDACELADHDGKPHLLRDEFEPLVENHNDYLRLSCQLGLIDNVRAGRTVEYFLTDYAKKISADATTDSAQKIIKDCVWAVVKSGKETLPQERHAVFLLWYILKLRSEGIDPSEEYFDRGNEKNYYPLIRLNFSRSLREFLFGGDASAENEYFAAWEKVCG